jgi:cytidylate kinase
VKLILEDSTHKEAIVTAIKDQNTFAVEKWDEFKMEISDELFVYGKNVKDFLRVDKIKLGVLALAGVKELTHIVEKQQAKIEEQSQAINTLTESMKFLTEHLAKLTNAFNEIVKEK